MGLQEQIDRMRQEIRVDGYAMSIGEWISLYENQEIDIHPEFKSFFRWSNSQKTSFIESILLGIPIPPIFVSQRDDGVWDVVDVDGVERLSTIYEFVGKLKHETQEALSPLIKLEETKYLPDLKGKKWNDPDDPENSLTPTQRLLIKRTKIYANILLNKSDELAKYELFKRLNTGGSIATRQEMINCILVMENKDMFQWLKELSENANFQECIALSDRLMEEQYDIELLLRFIVFRKMEAQAIKKIGDLGDFLTDQMITLAQNNNFNYQQETEAFQKTFEILQETGSDSFRKYDHRKNKFFGGFLVSAYEAIALGIGYHYENISNINIGDKIKEIWKDSDYTDYVGSGLNAQTRMP
ncbi:MAG: GmrSD restriction endonuclease domain-containing protein, partial [Microcoleaceae cyanobacterium]